MRKIMYGCLCLLMICESLFGQVNDSMGLAFKDVKDKGRNLTFLSYKKVTDTLNICKLPDISTDCHALYQVLICANTKNLQSSVEISIPQNYFYVYVGLDVSRGKKFISVDINVDNDFSNDSVYTVALADYSKFNIQENLMDFDTRLRFTYNANGQVKERSVPIIILPFYSDKRKTEYDTEEDYLLDIGILTNTTKESFFTLEKENYKAIASSESSMNLLPWSLSQASAFTFYGADGKFRCGNRMIGDTILLSNRKVLLESVRGDSLFIKGIGDFLLSNGVNEFSPEIYVHSLQNGQPIKLPDLMNNKYVFIDFWGSWCGPCIHSIPLVKKLYEKVKNRTDVLVAGIAWEQNSDLSKLTRTIADLQIPYENFVVYSKEKKSIKSPHTFWAIESFPTYLILDKNGKVVHKMSNSKETEKAIAAFMELIDGVKTP